ncbi:LacI family transcriptional regulator [Ensifer sp. WSM1721]|uniref:LacI family DNA-binding transcriptional regulator n=1 Tax=Ensifer sp. WSM1721 TaxID=1041159 RepID=UPI00047DF617|nr:LacI family DNA-binding transcriptional regulator [Ensifer sp. WSM1721]
MSRPTIADLAQAAGVSLSTVNRLLHGTGTVRPATVQRIMATAEEIGFYGLGAIRERSRIALPRYKLGFLLQQSHRQLYRMFGDSIVAAAARRKDAVVEPTVHFEDDLTPEAIAANLLNLGERTDGVALVAADHPLIGQAIESLRAKGVPVITYITDQSAPSRAGYVGTDNWKLGRTAAWFINQTKLRPGKIVTFIGNHRYHCQDIADASFRSYIREHAPNTIVADAVPTQEEPENAYRIVRSLMRQEPDLIGFFVGGGGISGVLRAVREVPLERQREIRIVCRDIGPETRKGLSEGLITAALCHPLERTSDELIDVMLGAIAGGAAGSIVQRIVPFETVTPECV